MCDFSNYSTDGIDLDKIYLDEDNNFDEDDPNTKYRNDSNKIVL